MSLHEIILTVSSNAPSPLQHNKQTLVSLHLLDTKDCTGKTRLDKKQNELRRQTQQGTQVLRH